MKRKHQIKLKLPIHLVKFYTATQPINGLSIYNNLLHYGLEVVCTNQMKTNIYQNKKYGFLEIAVLPKVLKSSYQLDLYDEKLYTYVPTLLALIFQNTMVNWIVAIKAYDDKAFIKDIIKQFLYKHNITEEDYRYRTAEKMWTKYRKTQTNPYLVMG